jgi:hypothetical protein
VIDVRGRMGVNFLTFAVLQTWVRPDYTSQHKSRIAFI